MNPEQNPEQNLFNQRNKRLRRQNNPEEDPLVKTVLDVLGGEVQAIRSRGSAEPSHS